MSEDRDELLSTTFTTYYDERWVLGWDPTLETYFATVDRPDPTPDQQRKLQAWEDYYNSDDCLGEGLTYGDHVEDLGVARRLDHIAGTQPHDVTTAADLVARLEPHVQLSDHIRDRWLPLVQATNDGHRWQAVMTAIGPAADRYKPTTDGVSSGAKAANFDNPPRHARESQAAAALAAADYPRPVNGAPALSAATHLTTPAAARAAQQARR